MRVAVSCALAVLAAGLLSTGSLAPAARCTTPADQAVHPKPSSFAPRGASQSRVYGAPIQPRIFKSRPKKKDPELRSAPLPDSEPSASGASSS